MKELDRKVEEFKAMYDKFLIGCDAVEEEELWNKEELGEMEVFYVNEMTSIIVKLITADGNIGRREVEYLNKTFGFDYTIEELESVYEDCEDEIEIYIGEEFRNGIAYMTELNKKLAACYKEMLALILDIISESDGFVLESETETIEKLKAMLG